MQVFHTPVRLMPTTVSHSSGVTSSQRWIEHTPALATDDVEPSQAGDPVGHGVGHARGVTHIDRVGDHASAGLGSTSAAVVARSRRGRGVVEVVDRGAQVEGDHVGPLGGHAGRRGSGPGRGPHR